MVCDPPWRSAHRLDSHSAIDGPSLELDGLRAPRVANRWAGCMAMGADGGAVRAALFTFPGTTQQNPSHLQNPLRPVRRLGLTTRSQRISMSM